MCTYMYIYIHIYIYMHESCGIARSLLAMLYMNDSYIYICIYIFWTIHECDPGLLHLPNFSLMHVPWLIHTYMTHMTHSYMCHDFICQMNDPWLVHMPHASFIYVPWLIWLIHICAMTVYATWTTRDSLISTLLIRTCAMTHMTHHFIESWGT